MLDVVLAPLVRIELDVGLAGCGVGWIELVTWLFFSIAADFQQPIPG